MPTRTEVLYFGSGPACLPTSVLTRAAAALLNFEDSGIGITEQSHRSTSSGTVLRTANDSLRSLLSVPDDYSIIFMQGGATTQFSAAVYNLVGYWVQRQVVKADGNLDVVREKLKAAAMDYLITGNWSSKASEEAKRLFGDGMVNIVADARDAGAGKFGSIPDERTWKRTRAEDNIFTYFCDNETIDGVELPAFPKCLEEDGAVVACDMSSNILSRKVDVGKYHVIFAGAQKNIGTTGLTIAILRNSILETQPTLETLRSLSLPTPPILMSYPAIAKNNSLYNTLPIFDVWIAGEVMKELIAAGGLDVQEQIVDRKAKKLYDALEASPLFKVVPDVGCRSRMNLCFRIYPLELEGVFLQGAEQIGLLGLKGHRTVGGMRISNYNAIPEEGVDRLVEYINQFARRPAPSV